MCALFGGWRGGRGGATGGRGTPDWVQHICTSHHAHASRVQHATYGQGRTLVYDEGAGATRGGGWVAPWRVGSGSELLEPGRGVVGGGRGARAGRGSRSSLEECSRMGL